MPEVGQLHHKGSSWVEGGDITVIQCVGEYDGVHEKITAPPSQVGAANSLWLRRVLHHPQ